MHKWELMLRCKDCGYQVIVKNVHMLHAATRVANLSDAVIKACKCGEGKK